MKTPPFVLFVCLHGSAKSVMASQYFRRLAAERGVDVEVHSAGTEPDPAIPPGVVRGLLADGIDVSGLRPRAVTRQDLARASRVVAFGCDPGEATSPGTTIERWDDVPAVSEDFTKARDAIVARVSRLLDEWVEPR